MLSLSACIGEQAVALTLRRLAICGFLNVIV